MTQQVPPENLMGERDSQLRMLTFSTAIRLSINAMNTVVPTGPAMSAPAINAMPTSSPA